MKIAAPKSEIELLNEMVEALRVGAVQPGLAGYKPQPYQQEFHNCPKRGRLFMGGNRVGKTVSATADACMILCGEHPIWTPIFGKRFIRGRAIGVDFDNGVELILIPEYKRWIPKRFLIDGSWDKSYNKSLRMLTLTNGSTIEFRSYDQDINKFAGTSRHFCVDQRTQILTRRGWQTHTSILATDEVYTINPSTELGEWKAISSIYVAEVDEEMIHIKSRDMDALVTEDHRWLVQNKKTKKVYMTRTNKLSTNEQFIVSGNSESEQEDAPYSDNLISLVGWVITDGSISNGNMNIAQSSSANLWKCRIIESLLPEVKYHEYPYREGIKDGTQRYYSITGDLRLQIIDILGEEKLFPYEWASRLSLRQRNLLLDAIMLGDGFQDKTGRKLITQYDKQRREGFAALLSWCGHSVFIGDLFAAGKTKFSNRYDFSRISDASCEREKVSYKGLFGAPIMRMELS